MGAVQDETGQPGRREARKRATRIAIKQAADRLIAAQGFERTTVREIARAAQVTERTFYRYFDGKEGIVADEADRWIARVGQAIRVRPVAEPPLASVRAALLGLAREVGERSQDDFVWLLADSGGAVEALSRTGTRPLRRLEAEIADALAARVGAARHTRDAIAAPSTTAAPGTTAAPSTTATPDRFELAVIGRVAAALLRSVMIERRRLLAQGGEPRLGTGELIERAFATLPRSGTEPAAP